jgi:hypothetical protein
MRDSAGYETIVFERRRPVGLLTLDRPERLDAINRQMIDEFTAARTRPSGTSTCVPWSSPGRREPRP